ncbi:IS5 family transposase [Microvirga sp. VF16]|uniref:IS5 family transposase n=1 Tax=Microvirga sp. VF16 TaxID=2807101 RepID=UPI00193E043A|nr:IS5 family transposase [Microvirga sp. VF16]QRM33194.1 IS5 family transposase [Microvirga sp. VF16]
MPFKAHAARRHRIPKQRHRVTNWAEYDTALRQRGSLTVWFTEEAIAAWRAEPRTTRGGQPHYSALAIRTALTLRAVFRLALRQTEGLIGSILQLLGLDLAVRDHSTLSRWAEMLEMPRPVSRGEPVYLLVDSTGLRLCGSGEWLAEKHGTRRRRSWRKLHIGVDAETGQILATELTPHDVDDGSQIEPLLDQITGSLASLTGDGADDQAGVYGTVDQRHPEAQVVVPPRSTAVPSDMAESTPTQRDRHLQSIAERGRMGWQQRSGYTRRALVETSISRFKRVIGDALGSRTEPRRATEVAIAVHALNCMLEFGRPKSIRTT